MSDTQSQQYRTSRWYSGHGALEADDAERRFRLQASLTVESEVRVVTGVFDRDNSALADFYSPFRRCVVVIDETVDQIYGPAIRNYFDAHQLPSVALQLRAWEADKVPRTIDRILAFFRAQKVSRHEPVLVIGGGVLSDIAGLAAALHHRRTPYVMIGTTVISAIDAGPSPRTCVNGDGFKNHMGAYHPPVLTLVDRQFFASLRLGHVRHGLAEILKMAFVDDPALFKLMREHGAALLETRFAAGERGTPLADIADEVIYRALRSYMGHEGVNPWEVHQARPHAYGHTWSPGYELPSGLLHGHAVSLGMSIGATLAQELGWLNESQRVEIVELCAALGLTVNHPVLDDVDLLLQSQRKMIEKRGGRLWAPLPRDELGQCDYVEEVPEALLRAVVKRHRARCSSGARAGLGIEMYLSDLGAD